jgi:hypothetical protein
VSRAQASQGMASSTPCRARSAGKYVLRGVGGSLMHKRIGTQCLVLEQRRSSAGGGSGRACRVDHETEVPLRQLRLQGVLRIALVLCTAVLQSASAPQMLQRREVVHGSRRMQRRHAPKDGGDIELSHERPLCSAGLRERVGRERHCHGRRVCGVGSRPDRGKVRVCKRKSECVQRESPALSHRSAAAVRLSVDAAEAARVHSSALRARLGPI